MIIRIRKGNFLGLGGSVVRGYGILEVGIWRRIGMRLMILFIFYVDLYGFLFLFFF